MESLISKYTRKTKRSAKVFKKSTKFHVNGVSHNIRFFEPYPFVTKSAKGKIQIDVDNNKYTDYWMGHWSLILGHGPTAIKNRLQAQLAKGWMYGTVNEQTIKLSEMIQQAVKAAEKIRYVTSGTEATMYAARLARSSTNKKIIVKIDGGWHGYTSDLLKTVNWPFTKSESSGLTNQKHIVSIPYNDLTESIKILKMIKKDLAAVIIEPVLGGGGCIPATPDYLKGIQEFVHKNNALLILDEIVTGFRLRYGCIYPTMKLQPDIVTLGKIVGGGLPIGVICGSCKVMKYADTKKLDKEQRSYVGGGTFSANPVSMVAGFETLSKLKKDANRIYSKINKMGQKIRMSLDKTFDGKTKTTGRGSLFMTHFTQNKVDAITNASDAARCNTELLNKYHFEMIVNNNIFFLPGKLGAFSYAHTNSDVKDLIAATQQFVENNKI